MKTPSMEVSLIRVVERVLLKKFHTSHTDGTNSMLGVGDR